MGVNETLERNEARVFFDHDHLSDVFFTIGGGSLALFSSRSPDKGGPNEDAAGILATGPDSAVIAVADGVGGAPAGSRASARAIECVLHAVQQAMREEQDLRHSLLSGFDAANEQVLSLGVGAATTLTAVVIHGCEIRAFHVGDSFMLITGQRGKVKLQTIPQSPVGYGVESGLLDEKEAMYHEERHLISNMVGTADMRIDVGSPYDLAPNDTLVLSTDGLSDNLHMAEIVECVRKGPLRKVAPKLAGMATERMEEKQPDVPSKPDDLTFLIFRLS